MIFKINFKHYNNNMTQQEALQKASEALNQAIAQKKISQEILNNLTPAVIANLQPILNEIANNTKLNKEELIQALSQIKIDAPAVPKAQVDVHIPEIKVPTPQVTVNVPKIDTPIIPPIKIPEIKVPKPEITVKVPPIKIPDLKWPEGEMDIKGFVNLMGYDRGLLENPLPVQIRDANGNPVDLFKGLSTVIAGSGGKADYFTIKGFSQSAFAEIMNADGEVKVAGTFTASAPATTFAIIGNNELLPYNGDNPLPVVFGASATQAVNIVDSSGIGYSGSNPVPVTITSGATATSAVVVVDSTGIPYGGDNPLNVDGTVAVSGITGSVGATILNGEGLARDSWLISDITNSVKASLVDSTGIQYSGSNPFSVTAYDIFKTTVATNLINADDRLRVSLETGGSGLTDAELRASSVPVAQISDAIWSTQVTGSFGTLFSTADMVNSDNRLRVSLETGGSGLTDAELRASSVPTEQVSGSIWSVYVTGGGGATSVSILNADGTYRDTFPVEGTVAVSGITGSVGATILNGEGLARDSWLISDITASVKATLIDSGGVGYSGSNPVPTTIVSGSITSTGAYLLNAEGLYRGTIPVEGTITANLSATDNAVLDTIDAVLDTINAKLVTGTDIGDVTINNASGASAVNIQDGGNTITVDGTVAVSGVTASIGASILGSDGLAFGTSKPIPVTMVTGVSASVNAAIIDSAGNYRDTFPISGNVNVNGSLNSVLATGTTLHDSADDGDAPLKMGGVAIQDNPTAVAGGDRVKFTADDLGRQLVRPVQARDLIRTAYVSLVSGTAFGTETTLLASGSGAYLDLIYMMGTNSSDVSVDIEFRASTAGTVCQKLTIPGGGTAGVALSVPYPAPFADHTWTIDAPDITGTNVTITALFSKEV